MEGSYCEWFNFTCRLITSFSILSHDIKIVTKANNLFLWGEKNNGKSKFSAHTKIEGSEYLKVTCRRTECNTDRGKQLLDPRSDSV